MWVFSLVQAGNIRLKTQFCLYRDMLGFAPAFATTVCINVAVFNIILLSFLKKSSLLSTPNVRCFVLPLLFTCSLCSVIAITCFSALYICLFFFLLL